MIMSGQLDLFESIDNLYNQGLNLLLELRINAAEAAFQEYGAVYPGLRDLRPELKICRVLSELVCAAKENPAAAALRAAETWKNLVEELGVDPNISDFHTRLRGAVFKRLTAELENGGDDLSASVIPCDEQALWHLWAGKSGQAKHLLETELKKSPRPPARLLGYLGDAHYRLGHTAEARHYYREAFSRNAAEVDIDNLADSDLAQFIDELNDDDVVPQPARFWAAATGTIRGVFPPPRTGTEDACAILIDDYRWLNTRKNPSALDAGRMFHLAMVLDGLAGRHQKTGGFDSIELRRTMKRLAPELFQEYLEKLPLFPG